MAQQFGYATLRPQAQTQEGIIPAANPAQPAFLVGSVCVIEASFFDNTGQPMVPQALTYQINDECTGAQILAPTSVEGPLAVQQIKITGAQNVLISNSLDQETHQVTLAITDPSGVGPYYERCLFDLITAPGVA
jgi:hypothetical protein